MQPKRLSPDEAYNALEKGALLVDVRGYDEVEARAFLTDKVWIMPITEFAARCDELPENRLLILACTVGMNSLKTAYYLINKGYDNVANLEGGIEAWEQAGLPVFKDPSKIKESAGCCCGGTVEEEQTDCCPDDSGSCC